MKKIYLTIAILALANLMQAQLTLTKAANEPVIGDVQLIKDYDTTTAVPKNSGIGISWNFTSFTAVASPTYANTYTTVAGTSGATLFPTANFAMLKGNSTETEYHKTSATTWEFLGNYDTNGPTAFSFTNSAVLMNWPVSIGSAGTDTFSGTQTSGTNVSVWNGVVTYSAAGSGTVILPGNNAHNNCLQFIQTVSITMTSGTVVTNLLMSEYQYYSSSAKFPIVIAHYESVTTGTNVSKDAYFRVDLPSLTVGMTENISPKNGWTVFPNPCSDRLFVNGKYDRLELLDLTGRSILIAGTEGILEVIGLKPSIYILRIKSGDVISTKRVVIME